MPCVQCFPAAFSKPSLISLYHFDCSGSTETFWQWNSAIQNLLVPFMVNLLQLLWPVVGATFTTSLLPVRRCYIRPPEADDGCKLLKNLSSSAFGLNNFGQDTTAQRHCLHYLREAQKVRWTFDHLFLTKMWLVFCWFVAFSNLNFWGEQRGNSSVSNWPNCSFHSKEMVSRDIFSLSLSM